MEKSTLKRKLDKLLEPIDLNNTKTILKAVKNELIQLHTHKI